MKKYNKLIGNYGENLATDYLKSKDYKILNRNFICKLGEIDIIASKNNIIVFIEVKSRFSTKFCMASESIDIRKRFKIIKVANYYLTISKATDFFVRFDSIEINFSKDNSKYEIIHKEDSFRPYS